MGKNKKLIGYRKMTGLTQGEIALMLGMTQSTYCNKENGKAEFTNREMDEIHKILVDMLKPPILANDLKIVDIFF